MIWYGRWPRGAAARARLVVVFLAALVLRSFAVPTAASGDDPPPKENAPHEAAFKMVGAVTVEGSGEPVSGVAIRVQLGKFDDSGRYQTLTAMTGAEGQYSIALPVGQARVWMPQCPPGYWSDAAALETVVTTVEKPVITRNYLVRRGPAWRFLLWDGQAKKPIAGAYFTAYRMQEGTYVSTMSQTDDQGIARLTTPGVRGEFQISAWDVEQRFRPSEPASLTFERGFRPDQAFEVTADAKPGVSQIKDKQGKTATLKGARATLDDSVLVITLEAPAQSAVMLGQVTGMIVDENDQPVEGAAVGMSLGIKKGASGMTLLRTVSDADGRFAIGSVPTGDASQQLTVVVTKDGYAALDSKPYDLPTRPDQPVDVGRLRLAVGRSLSVRVVDPAGEPLVGAWVEPIGSYATRTQLAVTDAQGQCLVRNLSKGAHRFHATFGGLAAEAVALVGEEPGETTIRLRPVAVAQPTPPARPDPVKPGQLAPPLRVSGWTDGQSRTLADFKGKVVVLDFWGTWCGPCVRDLPAMKNLHRKYQDKGVIFVAIHTAGEELQQVQEFQRQFKWDALIGIDEGDEIARGATVLSYGVKGFPAVLIIGRDGRIAYSTDAIEREDGMKAMQQAANALSLPWPLDETAPEEQLTEHVTRLREYMLSQAIDQALATQ